MKKIEVRKSKGLAILLAIIFGPLSYFYTYEKDSKKLWSLVITNIVSLCLFFFIIPLLIPIGVWIYVVYDMITRKEEDFIM